MTKSKKMKEEIHNVADDIIQVRLAAVLQNWQLIVDTLDYRLHSLLGLSFIMQLFSSTTVICSYEM